MRPPALPGNLVCMNVDQRSLPGALAMAHRVLWTQGLLCGLAWLLPNATVAAVALTHGVPDDGTAPYLLIPVVFTLPLLLFAVPGLVLAARFRTGGRGVHAGVVVYEGAWVLAAVLLFPVYVRPAVGGPPVLMPLLLLSVVAAAAVLAAVLAPAGRARFRGDARP